MSGIGLPRLKHRAVDAVLLFVDDGPLSIGDEWVGDRSDFFASKLSSTGRQGSRQQEFSAWSSQSLDAIAL